MDGFHKAIKRGMRPYGSTNGTIAGLSVSRAGHCRSWKADIRSGREEIPLPTPSFLPPYRYGEATFADDSGIGNLESMISCRSPDNARFRFEKVERHLCSRYPFVYASARCCYCYYYTISFIVVNESVITNYPRIDRIFPRFP